MSAKSPAALCFLLEIGATVMLATDAAAEERQGLLFQADFDQGFDATFSRGRPQAEVQGAALVEGRRGKALVVRGEGSYCRFPAVGNLSPKGGTVMMWVQPLDWDGHDDQFRHFFGTADPQGGVLSLYRYHSAGNLLWLVGSSKEQRWGIAEFPIGGWKAGEWHHLAATWERGRFGDGETALFLDGWKVAGWLVDRDVYPTTLGDHFTLGTAGTGLYEDPTRATAIDDVFIFDHALTPFQIQQWFEQQGGDVGTLFSFLPQGPPQVSKDKKVSTIRTVPSPWTPVKIRQSATGNRQSAIAVECWGRQYHLGSAGLPIQITSAGAELLAAPISLQAVIQGVGNGRRAVPTQWTKSEARFLSTSETEATFVGEQRSRNLVLKTRGRLEFDGMLRLDVELRPGRAGRVERLERLWLEVPFQPERARYLYACTDKFWETWAGTLPESGWQSAFYPFVWLGDEERGLCWFAESEARWSLAEPREAIAVTREAGATLLRVTLVTSPISLREPLRLTFGLQATPVKPFPPDWRKWRMTDATTDLGGPGHLGIIWTVHPFTKWFGYPEAADEAQLKQRIADLHQAGRLALPYWNLNRLSAGAPAWRKQGLGWTTLTGGDFVSSDVKSMGHPFMPTCPAAPDWADFILGRLSAALDRYDADGFYQDGFMVGSCDNVRHGCGNPSLVVSHESGAVEKGTLVPDYKRPHYPIFAARELFKRAYVLVKSKKPHGVIIGHCSGCLQIPILSFADAYLDGEHKTSGWYRLKGRMVGGDWLRDRLPLDTLRTEYMGRQWGVVPFFLPGFYAEKKPEDTSHMMALLLLHDLTPWDIHCHRETVHHVWQALDEFGVAEAEFLGYWQPDLPVRAEEEGRKGSEGEGRGAALVSLYRKPAKVLLVVANLGTSTHEARLWFDWSELGVGRTRRLRDVLTGEVLSVEGDTIRLQVPAEGFRLLVLATATSPGPPEKGG